MTPSPPAGGQFLDAGEASGESLGTPAASGGPAKGATMASVEKFGKHAITRRTMHLLEIDSLDDWPEELDLKSKHFVLFLACDATDVLDEDLQGFAGRVIDQGMVYLSTWGNDAERVHDVFDEVDADRNPDSNADSVVLSEWHEDEPLPEALRFAVATATPAHDYEKSCKATLCVSVGNPDWAEQIRGWLADPESLEKAVEEEDEGEEEEEDLDLDGDGDDEEEEGDEDEDEEDEEEDEDEDYDGDDD